MPAEHRGLLLLVFLKVSHLALDGWDAYLLSL